MTSQEKSDSYYENQIRMSKSSASDEEERLLKLAVLRLNGNVIGLVCGIVAALGVFIATNWLVLKSGEVVGPHLSLLGQFFIGYSVTFTGSLIGSAYALVTGYLCGLVVSWIYNFAVMLRFGK